MTAPRPLPLPLGGILSGKYRIDTVLGEGGMGVVFAAENLDLGRTVAIKVLHGDLACDEGLVQRFRQEARAAAAVGHSGIVDVLDLGTTEDGAPFIVMERLDGESMGARLQQRGRLRCTEAVAHVLEALDALAAAHAKGIVHRDLKPDNLFLVARPAQAVKLVDFGISKLQGGDDLGLTTTGVVMGTPLYMSPEQARGARDIGAATDVYSMGAILYQALSGHPPLTGASYNELIARLLMEEPTPLATRRPGLPASLTMLVHTMLAKDPATRPTARYAHAQLGAIALELDDVADAEEAVALDATIAPPTLDATAPASPPQRTSRGSPPGPLPRAATPQPVADPVVAAAPAPALASQPRLSRAVIGMIAAMVVALAAIATLVVVASRGGREPARAAASPDAGAVARVAVDAAAPVVVAAADAAPAPAMIVITLEATPASATWSLDGAPLDCNPCSLSRAVGARHRAVATGPGLRDEPRELTFDAPRTVRATLRARREPRPGRPDAGVPRSGSGSSDGELTIDEEDPNKKKRTP